MARHGTPALGAAVPGALGLFDPADHDSREPFTTARDEAEYAALLRKAVLEPELLSEIDRAHLLPDDVDTVAAVLDHHIDAVGSELARRHREQRTGKPHPRHPAISSRRWLQILASIKDDTFRYTDLSIDEILAIDNDPDLKAQYAAAQDEAWGSGGPA